MDPSPPQEAPRSNILHWVIAVLLAAVLLYFSLRGIDWQQVWQTLQTTRFVYVILMAIIGMVSLTLRAVRWRVLLLAGGPVRISTAYWATCAGYFGNSYLPARAGELIRTVAVDAEAGLGRSFVLTTALSERMVDAIALVLISSVVLLTLPERPGWYAGAAKPFMMIGMCGVLGIAILPKLERFWHYLLDRTPVPVRFRGALKHILQQVLNGLRAFHDVRRLLLFVGLTAAIWPIDAIVIIIGARSVDMTLNASVAFLLITGLGLGSALPSTPGYVGIYQFVSVSVLTPFGFSQAAVIAFTLLLQVQQYVVTGIWGVLAIWRFRKLNLKITWKLRSSADPPAMTGPAARPEAG